MVLKKITTFFVLAGSLAGSAVKTCCAINGQPWCETAGNTDNKQDKLSGRSVKNQVSYALTGFTTQSSNSWTIVSMNFEMDNRIYNFFKNMIEEHSKKTGSNDEWKTLAKNIFQSLSGKNDASPILKEHWNPLIKNEFEHMEYDISVKIGVSSSTLWNRFWEDEDEARYFVKIIENAHNPLGNWWIGSRPEEQTADNYIKACRNYGANFNLKFERNGYSWVELNSYLVVAQQNMPRTIKEIWYNYINPLEKSAPVINLYLKPHKGKKKIEEVEGSILSEFSRWLTGRRQPKYSFELYASDLAKEFSDGVPIHLTFWFFTVGHARQPIPKPAVQEAIVILH